jgi:hypothetical protein
MPSVIPGIRKEVNMIRFTCFLGVCLFLITVLASSLWATPPHADCPVVDYYWEPASADGEAEIVRLHTAIPENVEEVQCQFAYGDTVAFVVTLNDWPGGELGLEGFVFWCNRPYTLLCVSDITDFGYVPDGDIRVVTLGRAIIPRVDCRVDWGVKILCNSSEWDIGGFGKLKPGPDTGPNDDCGCFSVSH